MVVKAWRKELMLYEPVQAGAFAILWALELAVTEKFQKIIVPGDSKICIDAINGDQNDVEWFVATIINNIVSLSSSFNSCLFSWVWREANVVAHTLAKHVPSPTDFFFVCNSHSLTRSV
jgi:ribonuclease HI